MKTHTNNKQPSLILLIVIAMTSPLALNLFIPAMPSAVIALHTDIATMQLTYSCFLLTLAFGQLISGPLADYFGRYPVLVTGLIIHFFGCVFALLADDINLLIAARVLQALGGSACMSMARTMTLDIYGRDKSASKMSYLVMAIALSQTLAPTLGGYVNLYFNWQAIFIISSSIAFGVCLLAIKQLTETCPQKSTSLKVNQVLHQYSQVLKSNQYIGYALSSTFIACAFYLFIGSAPYIVVNHLGGNSADFGNWFLMVALAFMLGSLCSGTLTKRMTIDTMISIGHTISLFGATLLLLLNGIEELNYFSLFVPMSLLTFGRGLSQPSAQSAAISCALSRAGTASGLLGFIQLIIGASIAQLVPLLMGYNIKALFFIIFLAPVFALICHYLTVKSKENKS
ncbi:multidrug effflux MFS transporter [Candidatus Colwellia aromaticivorans]|uniref:multidrug effflux MFS transporter n=1 Tax=Candidatus Colwellia aromaticivorans TaxID=2267621 RepID=UPI000DF33D6A|nr:multidrug effflux MFS transporter [Candidatus Colwellia aromaticivorans]